MNKILTLALFLGLAFTASAQDIVKLNINRFTASLPAGAQNSAWTTSATLKASQTDTTEWFAFNSPGISDTLLEVLVGTRADSMHASIKVQYGGDGLPILTNVIDSIKYNAVGVTAAAFAVPAKGKSLWFTRPPGATQVRVIVATAATGNQNGLATQAQNKTYWVGIATRIKK